MYRSHRNALMKRLADGVIFVLGGREILRNGDVHYPFRQHSHFLYLCGVEAPGYALLLRPETGEEVLFIPKIDQSHRVWLGDVPGPKESKALYGVRKVATLDELPQFLKPRRKTQIIYGDLPSLRYLRPLYGPFQSKPKDFEDALSELRAVKSEAELTLLAEANAVTRDGHLAAMRAVRPGMREYEVQAILEHVFHRAGLTHTAYPSIVASGAHSAVLHYHHNSAKLRDGDLLLIDAGAECQGYAADVTRVFPVSGRFSPEQREIYEIVLVAQTRAIAQLKPGVSALTLHLESARSILQGLAAMNIIKGSVNSNLERGVDRVFYPHGLSHMLGLDVHDVTGGKSRQVKLPPSALTRKIRFDRILEPGFVITVEPGLYFIPALLHDPKIRRTFKDVIDFDRAERLIPLGGVRIEDDVAITATGHRNLTSVPKTIAEIEAICQGRV